MKALLEGLRALGPARLAAMGAVALGMLGILALMVLQGGSDQMALLYGDLDMRDSAQVVEQLSHQHIPYRIAGGGSQILVPADQVPQARLALAKEGLPSGGAVGYEIFDRGDGLAATEFQQQINQTRAWKASWRGRYAPCTASGRCACIWCCRGGSRSRATARMHRPA